MCEGQGGPLHLTVTEDVIMNGYSLLLDAGCEGVTLEEYVASVAYVVSAALTRPPLGRCQLSVDTPNQHGEGIQSRTESNLSVLAIIEHRRLLHERSRRR